MGGVVSSIDSENNLSPTRNDISFWDMVLHLFKRYVISKVENDEFLCAYLLNTDHNLNFLRMGQKAITFEPLPCRIKYDEKYDKQYETSTCITNTSKNKNAKSKIEEYVESESEEYVESESEEYTESESEEYTESESEEYVESESEKYKPLLLYSMYNQFNKTSYS